MGGGSPPSQTTNTVTQAVPAYLQAGQQQGIGYADNLANTQFQPYTGQAVAPFSPMQQQYFQGVENQQGAWQPTTEASQNVYGNVAGGQYTPTITQTNAHLNTLDPSKISQGISNYYDPAVQKEIGGMQNAIQNTADIQNAAAGRQAGTQGAYGGSGSALLQAQNNKNAQLAMGQYTSQLLPQVYNQALGASQQDITNQQNALTTMGQQSLAANAQNLGYAQLGEQAKLGAGQLALGGAQALEGSGYNASGAGYNDTNQLGAAGTAQQTEAQNQLNFPLSQYNTALSWPFQTMAEYNQSLGTATANPGLTTTSSAPYSPLASGIGTGLAAYGALNSLNSSTGSASGGRIRMNDGGPVRLGGGGGLGFDDGSGGDLGMGYGFAAGDGPASMAGVLGLGGDGGLTQPPAAVLPPVAPTQPAVAPVPAATAPNPSAPPAAKPADKKSEPGLLDAVQKALGTKNQRTNDLLINMGAAMMSHGNNNVAGIGKGILEGANATASQHTELAKQGLAGAQSTAAILAAVKDMSPADRAKFIQTYGGGDQELTGLRAVKTGLTEGN